MKNRDAAYIAVRGIPVSLSAGPASRMSESVL